MKHMQQPFAAFDSTIIRRFPDYMTVDIVRASSIAVRVLDLFAADRSY